MGAQKHAWQETEIRKKKKNIDYIRCMKSFENYNGKFGFENSDNVELCVPNRWVIQCSVLERLIWQQPTGLIEEIRDQRQEDQLEGCYSNAGVKR